MSNALFKFPLKITKPQEQNALRTSYIHKAPAHAVVHPSLLGSPWLPETAITLECDVSLCQLPPQNRKESQPLVPQMPLEKSLCLTPFFLPPTQLLRPQEAVG